MNGERTDRQTARLAGASREGEQRPAARQGGMRPAGVAAARVAGPIVARRGGGLLGRLKAEWAAIVGSELAVMTWPVSLGRDGALKLYVASRIALDLQHRAPLVIERINLFFGHRAVARLVLVQGPLPVAAGPGPAPPAAPSAAEAVALDARLAGIADPELRAALARLGQLVLAGARRGGEGG